MCLSKSLLVLWDNIDLCQLQFHWSAKAGHQQFNNLMTSLCFYLQLHHFISVEPFPVISRTFKLSIINYLSEQALEQLKKPKHVNISVMKSNWKLMASSGMFRPRHTILVSLLFSGSQLQSLHKAADYWRATATFSLLFWKWDWFHEY